MPRTKLSWWIKDSLIGRFHSLDATYKDDRNGHSTQWTEPVYNFAEEWIFAPLWGGRSLFACPSPSFSIPTIYALQGNSKLGTIQTRWTRVDIVPKIDTCITCVTPKSCSFIEVCLTYCMVASPTAYLHASVLASSTSSSSSSTEDGGDAHNDILDLLRTTPDKLSAPCAG